MYRFKLLVAIMLTVMLFAACGGDAPDEAGQARTGGQAEPQAPVETGGPQEPTRAPVSRERTSTSTSSVGTTAEATPSPRPAKPDEASTATPVPTPTRQMPTATPPPAATAIPTPEPTHTPTATPMATAAPSPAAATWRGITVAPEDRCSPYDPDDYPYPPSVEPRIVEDLGGVYGPYTGTWFETIRETDIEHIVARSEAHDSGLCAADPAARAKFASDILNLTLASPSVNRHQKVAKDAAEWLPNLNQCWYVDRIVRVRREYGLTTDRTEAAAIDRVLAGCESTEMVMLAPGASTTPTAPATSTPAPDVDALALWDDNGNGRITCAEARAHGIAPVRRGHPAYQYMRDADGDGVVCE